MARLTLASARFHSSQRFVLVRAGVRHSDNIQTKLRLHEHDNQLRVEYLTFALLLNRSITVADVDPSEYDAEQEENVLLEELYPRVLLTEKKITSEKDDLDLDLDLLNDDTGVTAGNDNEDTPDKKKRRKENPTKGAPKTSSLSTPQPSSSKAFCGTFCAFFGNLDSFQWAEQSMASQRAGQPTGL